MKFDYRHIGMGFLALLAIALISWPVLIAGAFCHPAQFAFSYLLAFVFFFTISVGALFWVMLHHMVDAAWSVGIRRQLENVACLFFSLGFLFIPLVFVAPLLWTWMPHPPSDKADYLNPSFFWLRTACYFFVFSLVAFFLRGYSVAQDADASPRWTILNRRVAFLAAAPFALCLTFAAIDWLMSLDAHWFSAIWGVYIFAGSILSALCVIILIVTALRNAGYLGDVVTVEHYHIFGKLLLAFTVFWAYIAFSQYLLIWYANIPEETSYLSLRGVDSWRPLGLFLAAGHFFVPFLLLLPMAWKRRPAFLCAVAAWILLMHLLDLYIVIVPNLHPEHAGPNVMDFLSFIAIGSTLALVYLAALGRSALFPINDPRVAECRELDNE